MSHMTLICAHCGFEHAVPLPAPPPEHFLACSICGHGELFERWVAHTIAEFAAVSADRLRDSSRYG